VCALGLASLLAACNTKSAPQPRGLLVSEGQPARAAPPAPAPQEPETAPAPPFPELPSQSVFGAAAAPTPTPTPSHGSPSPAEAQPDPAPPAAAAPKRDLSAELAGLIPAPVDCLDLAQAAAEGGKVSISVSAMVMPSGFISRATANVAGQPREALHCIESKVAQGALKPDVPGAPLEVQASLPFEVVARPMRAPPPSPAAAPLQLEYAKPEKLEYAKPEKLEYAQPDGTEIARPVQ
jgi:hypothetical protein